MKKISLLFLLLSITSSLYSLEKPLITVLDFVGSGVSEQERGVLVDFISSHIVSSSMYRVIDRMQRDAILQELEFSYSGCADESCQLEIGKLLQAEQIIVGSLGKVGALFLLNMKMIDVVTGETVHTGSKQYESMEDLINNSKALTLSFLKQEALPDTEAGSSADREYTASESNLQAVKARNEKQKKLDSLLLKFDVNVFNIWLNENNYNELYRSGSIDDKLEVAEEYYEEVRSRWSLDAGLMTMILPFEGGSSDSAGNDIMPMIGVSADIFYHFSDGFALGFGLSPSYQIYSRTYSSSSDEMTVFRQITLLNLNINLLFGDKDNLSFLVGVFGDPYLDAIQEYNTAAGPLAEFVFPDEPDSTSTFSNVGPVVGVYFKRFFLRIKFEVTGANPWFLPIYINAGYSVKL